MNTHEKYHYFKHIYLRINRLLIVACALFAFIFFIPISSLAEGTRTISPSSSSLTALSLQPSHLSGSYLGSPSDNRIRFRIKDYRTEVLYYGFNWISYYAINGLPLTNMYMKIYDPDGLVVGGRAIKLSSSGAGYISSYQSAMAGPQINTSNTNGYLPSKIIPKKNGDYSLEIYQSNDGGLNQYNPTSSAAWSKSPYFDLTVATADGTIKDGRVYCKKWAFTAVDPSTFQPTLAASSEAVVYPYTNDSLIYRLSFKNGFRPGDFTIAMNNYGVLQGNNWANDRKSINSANYIDLPNGYSVFLNSPDLSEFPTVSQIPLSPIFANPAIVGLSTGDYQVRFNIRLGGDCQLLFDLNGTSGFQPQTSDRIIEFIDCKQGLNIVTWDGKDGLGNRVTNGQNVNLSIIYKKGRTNLPLYDAEINKNGFVVDALYPISKPSLPLYWDDSSLVKVGSNVNDSTQNITGAGFSNILIGSVSPAHAWNGDGNATQTVPAPSISSNDNDALEANDFGNVRVINTWFYGIELTSKISTQIKTVSISGTVWNDVNNSANKSFNNIFTSGELGANAGLYVSLIDPVTNLVLSVASVNASGVYKLSGCPVNGANLPIIISAVPGTVGSLAPKAYLPYGWDNTSPLVNSITTGTVDIASADFGIQQKPTAFDVDMPEVPMPGGTGLLNLTSDVFDGLDPDGGYITSVRITQFPSNIKTLVVDGVSYSAQTFPIAGITIPTNNLGQIQKVISIDPLGSWSTLVQIPYIVVDNASAQSEIEAISTIYFSPDADLKVIKAMDKTSALVGDTVKFTITATNNGPHEAFGVKATDLLKSGYKFLSASLPNYNSTTGIWTIDNLAKGTSKSLDIKAIVNTTGDFSNTVTINSLQTDTITSNNTFTINPVINKLTDLQIVKSVNKLTAKAGETLIYTLTVKNNGPNDATGVAIVDKLPLGLGYFSASNSGSFNSTTRNVTWPIISLANQATVTYTVTCIAKGSGGYTNTATVTGVETDKFPINNSSSVTPTVQSVADLQISKTASSTTYNAGDAIAFLLTVKNNGPSNGTNIVVVDSIPSGYTFVSAPGGTYNASTRKVTWNLASLVSQQSTSYTVNCTANTTGNYQNSASVSAAEFDSNLANNKATFTPVITTFVDLSIVKSYTPTPLTVGKYVQFKLAVTNNSLIPANGVTITDSIPSGYSFFQANGASYNSSTRKVTWPNLTVAPQSTVEVILVCQVKGVGNYTNTAKVTSIEKDPNLNNNSSTVTPPVTLITDLNITKSASSLTPTIGSQVTYTIIAKNSGPSTASGVTVTDQLPSGLIFVSATPSVGTLSNGVWTVGALSVNGTATLTMVCTVNGTGSYVNTATISGIEQDNVTTNNSASVTLTPIASPNNTDLSINKTVTSTTPTIGDQITYTITVKNNGPLNATGVKVTENLPTGLTYIAASGSIGSFVGGVWTVGNLKVGATEVLTMTCKVNPTGNYTNTASIVGNETDPDLTNNSSSVTLTPLAIPLVADLSIDKTSSEGFPLIGSELKFKLIATNIGPNLASNVKVNDKLPTGYSFKSYSSTNGLYTNGVWSIGSLSKGASATLEIVCTVNETGDYTNTATIVGDENDPNTVNNTSTVTPFVDHQPLAVADFFTPIKNRPYEGNVALNDKPSLDGGNVWTLLTKPAHGDVQMRPDGSFTYTPETDYIGADLFYYALADANLDKSEAGVTIQVERVIIVPQGFSPNGDNVNDYLVIEGIEDYPNNRLMVMNRWGNKVYEIKGYNNTWNGESNVGMIGNSNTLPIGTYYYILELNNGKSPIKGSIFLNR